MFLCIFLNSNVVITQESITLLDIYVENNLEDFIFRKNTDYDISVIPGFYKIHCYTPTKQFLQYSLRKKSNIMTVGPGGPEELLKSTVKKDCWTGDVIWR